MGQPELLEQPDSQIEMISKKGRLVQGIAHCASALWHTTPTYGAIDGWRQIFDYDNAPAAASGESVLLPAIEPSSEELL